MPRSTDKLAFALSAASRVSRVQYKRIFDHLFVTDAVSAGFALDESVKKSRLETEWNMEALGVCDFPAGDYLYSCPPYLALLPPAGLPSAVLAGARTPKLLERLRAVSRKHRKNVILSTDAQPAFPLLPQRYRITAENSDALRMYSIDAGLRVTAFPAAALMLTYSASVTDYISQLRWEPHFEPDWLRQDFDLTRSQFSSRASSDERRLTKYSHQSQTYRREFKLIDGDRAASVDRNWGRLAAYHWGGASPFQYDIKRAEVLLPVTVPLPRLHARALVACSGFAPTQRDVSGQGLFRVYAEVPPAIAALLATRLNVPPPSFT